jgi:hypothetical protein
VILDFIDMHLNHANEFFRPHMNVLQQGVAVDTRQRTRRFAEGCSIDESSIDENQMG